jgi:hypothetical protein
MRRFSDLTDAEVRALTPDLVRRYIDIECAEAGVPLVLLAVPSAPPPLDVVPDLELYEVAGLLFRTRTEATAVVDMLKRCDRLKADYNFNGGGWDHKMAHPDAESPAVKPTRLWTESGWEVHRKVVMEHQSLAAAHKKALEEHRAATKKSEAIESEIRERIREIEEGDRRLGRLRVELARYTELAEGSAEIAQRFLEKAHPGALALLGLAQGADAPPPPRPAPLDTPAHHSDQDLPF